MTVLNLGLELISPATRVLIDRELWSRRLGVLRSSMLTAATMTAMLSVPTVLIWLSTKLG